jgi:hypothetical protein
MGHAPKGSYDRVVVRGDLAAREFVAFWLDDANRIKAAMNVNIWDVIEQIKPPDHQGNRGRSRATHRPDDLLRRPMATSLK